MRQTWNSIDVNVDIVFVVEVVESSMFGATMSTTAVAVIASDERHVATYSAKDVGRMPWRTS